MNRKYSQNEVDDLVERALNSGRKQCLGHDKSAPETRERLTALETNEKNVMQELQDIKQMIKDLDSKLDCALEKKADRWVEKVLTWVGALIGASIVGTAIWVITEAVKRFQ